MTEAFRAWLRTPDGWTLANEICSDVQLKALDYWRRDCGYKRIGVALGISRDSARGRVDRALDLLGRELERRQEAA
jgi:hypothetical protein